MANEEPLRKEELDQVMGKHWSAGEWRNGNAWLLKTGSFYYGNLENNNLKWLIGEEETPTYNSNLTQCLYINMNFFRDI